MRGLFTGIAFIAVAIMVIVFTAGGVFDLFSGLFENQDVGTIVGLIAVFFYGFAVANIAFVLGIVLAAVVNAIFD